MNHVTTKTLAEIYFQQGHLQEAYEIYKTLAENDPFDVEIQQRLEELEEKLRPSGSLSNEEKIHHLEKWLANIRARRPN